MTNNESRERERGGEMSELAVRIGIFVKSRIERAVERARERET